jgi:extracellular factor (EF) 3-hydroxypalmitic acid methyl ester biosynthesis protein
MHARLTAPTHRTPRALKYILNIQEMDTLNEERLQFLYGAAGPTSLRPAVFSISPGRSDPARLLQELARAADALADLAEAELMQDLGAFHAVVAGIHRVAASARACAVAGLTREDMGSELQRLRRACEHSPFTRHITTWPRGYPGDFEIIDYILAQQNKAAPGTLSYWIEEYSLGTTVAQQHRNKVASQAAEIVACVETALSRNEDASIAVLACGSSPDLVQVQNRVAHTGARFVVADSDEQAIRTTVNRLPALAGGIETITGNVVRTLGQIAQRGPYDLVLAGGLFDYLSDPVAELVVRRCIGMLRPGARFFFTNMAPGNPYDDWIRYVCDWALISRDEEAIRNLVVRAAGSRVDVRTRRESTRLAVLATVCRSRGSP